MSKDEAQVMGGVALPPNYSVPLSYLSEEDAGKIIIGMMPPELRKIIYTGTRKQREKKQDRRRIANKSRAKNRK